MLLTDLQTQNYFNGFDYGTHPDYAPTITAYDEDDDDEDEDVDDEDDDLDDDVLANDSEPETD